jgi:hypothetical protein
MTPDYYKPNTEPYPLCLGTFAIIGLFINAILGDEE